MAPAAHSRKIRALIQASAKAAITKMRLTAFTDRIQYAGTQKPQVDTDQHRYQRAQICGYLWSSVVTLFFLEGLALFDRDDTVFNLAGSPISLRSVRPMNRHLLDSFQSFLRQRDSR